MFSRGWRHDDDKKILAYGSCPKHFAQLWCALKRVDAFFHAELASASLRQEGDALIRGDWVWAESRVFYVSQWAYARALWHARRMLVPRLIEHRHDVAHDAIERLQTRISPLYTKWGSGSEWGYWDQTILGRVWHEIRRLSQKLRNEEAQPELIDNLLPTAPSTVERILAQEERETLEAAMNSLSADFRHILELRHLEQKGLKEIAELLGISAGAAHYRLIRAIQGLRKILKDGL